MTRRALVVLALAAVLLVAGPARIAPRPARAAGSDPVVYVVGDSVFAGNYGVTNLPLRDKFARRIADRLCGVHCGQPGYASVVDVSVSAMWLTPHGSEPGWQTWWNDRVINATPRPTTVLLEVGINDMGNVGDTEFQTAYLDVASRTAAAGITFIPSTMFPINQHLSTYAQKTSQRHWMNEWLVRTYPVISRMDQAGQLPWNEDLDCTYNNFNLGVICASGEDGVHPNRLGVVSMADAVPVNKAT